MRKWDGIYTFPVSLARSTFVPFLRENRVLVGYSLYDLRPHITHLLEKCDGGKPIEKVFSVALLVVADGHFVNSGVAKSRSHPKGQGYLTATRRRAFLQPENQCRSFHSIFSIPFPGRCQSNSI